MICPFEFVYFNWIVQSNVANLPSADQLKVNKIKLVNTETAFLPWSQDTKRHLTVQSCGITEITRKFDQSVRGILLMAEVKWPDKVAGCVERYHGQRSG